MGLDGVVGVRGDDRVGERIGSVDAVETQFDSLALAFSSSRWAMHSQLEERSILRVQGETDVATEREEGGRERNGGARVCGAVSIDCGGGPRSSNCFGEPMGE